MGSVIEFFALVVIYFIPTYIGLIKMKGNIWRVMLTNIFFGWTLIGWLVALYWSVKSQTVNHTDILINALNNGKK